MELEVIAAQLLTTVRSLSGSSPIALIALIGAIAVFYFIVKALLTPSIPSIIVDEPTGI